MPEDLAHLHNLEAEQALLSCIFLDPGAMVLAIERGVIPEWFWAERHRVLYQAMLDTMDDECRVDLVALQDHLRRKDLLDKAGGLSYVTSVLASEPTGAQAERYVEIVRRCYLYRRLHQVALELVHLARDPEGDVMSKIGQAQEKLAALADVGTVGTVRHLREAVEERRQDYERWRAGSEPGVRTGLGKLDDALQGGFQPATLNILAALTSRGKTALALQIALYAAQKGKPVLFFSLELTAGEVVDRLLAMSEFLEGRKLRQLVRWRWEQVEAGLSRLAGLPFWLDTTSGISVAEMGARVRRLMLRTGLELVVVDYLQYMAPPGQQYTTRNDEIGAITRGLKQLAKSTRIPFLVLSQLNRRPEMREGRRIAAPRLSDLRESGNIEQDADTVMFLHRPDFYKPDDTGATDLILAKHRQGPRTVVKLMFDKAHACFRLASPRTDGPPDTDNGGEVV